MRTFCGEIIFLNFEEKSKINPIFPHRIFGNFPKFSSKKFLRKKKKIPQIARIEKTWLTLKPDSTSKKVIKIRKLAKINWKIFLNNKFDFPLHFWKIGKLIRSRKISTDFRVYNRYGTKIKNCSGFMWVQGILKVWSLLTTKIIISPK